MEITRNQNFEKLKFWELKITKNEYFGKWKLRDRKFWKMEITGNEHFWKWQFREIHIF